MGQKNKNLRWIIFAVFFVLADLFFVLRYVLDGQNVALFNPKGLIAQQQKSLMLVIATILIVVAVLTLFLLFYTAWRYRESNPRSLYAPNAKQGKVLNLGMWVVPTFVMLVLATIMWSATHRLVPQKSIKSDAKPLRIQVVSMRWKWLFLYPDQNIATVNFVQVPVGTPVQFELTADDAPMSSFWIPNLGGQLYTMTGHVNRLNLMADTPGDYPGSSAEINGAGFSGMKFTARASTLQDFDRFVQSTKVTQMVLSYGEYERILKPSENSSIVMYSSIEPDLYDKVLMKYTGSSEGHMHRE